MDTSETLAVTAAVGRRVDLVWTGRPVQGVRLRARDALLVPFSTLFFGFAIFWEGLAIGNVGRDGTVGVLFCLWGVPFVLIGAFLFAGRFVVDAYLREHTVYALTDRDAYIVRDGLFGRTISYNLRSTHPIELRRRPDGSGSIIFGGSGPMRMGSSGLDVWLTPTNRFEGIADAARVYDLVMRAE